MNNKELYFYHLAPKNIENGLISLKYMYDNNMYELFDKYSLKYKSRIVNDWNIEKYYGKDENSLTREEIIDALNIFRGKNGHNYIYFFRYPPYKELGKNMSEVLGNKDIYRINIMDDRVKNIILNIFYGYNKSNSDNEVLDLEYYINISKEDYFKDYNDDDNMIFKNINHIGISFKDGICPFELLEKVN